LIELAKICRAAEDTCYGVELLNEPGDLIPRETLMKFYQETIYKMRNEA
jgi:hypothetical protein